MSKLKILLVVFGLYFGFAASINAGSFTTGNDYREYDEIKRNSYVSGVVDTMDDMQLNDNYAWVAPPRQCYRPMHLPQIREIVDNYLEATPQEWHLGMANIAIMAISEACEK
jgi:hypothetical protein